MNGTAMAMQDLIAQNKRLQAEVEALRRDAERYRWLRGQCADVDPLAAVVWKRYHGQEGDVQWLNTASAESLDRGIDTAIRARPGEKG